MKVNATIILLFCFGVTIAMEPEQNEGKKQKRYSLGTATLLAQKAVIFTRESNSSEEVQRFFEERLEALKKKQAFEQKNGQKTLEKVVVK